MHEVNTNVTDKPVPEYYLHQASNYRYIVYKTTVPQTKKQFVKFELIL